MEDSNLYKTIDNFKPKELIQLSKQKPLVSVFTANWLGSAYLLDTFFEELSKEYAEYFNFLRLNMNQPPVEVAEFKIEELPTTLILKDGEIVEQFIGVIPKRKIRQKLERIRN